MSLSRGAAPFIAFLVIAIGACTEPPPPQQPPWPPPEPPTPWIRGHQLDLELPPGWTYETGGEPSHVRFMTGYQQRGSLAYVVTADPGTVLERTRVEAANHRGWTTETTRVAGVEALKVHHVDVDRPDWNETSWTFLNQRGEAIELRLRDDVPSSERESLLASVKLRPSSPQVVGPFRIFGRTLVLQGSCMPPAPTCSTTPTSFEVVARRLLDDRKTSDVVARATSGPDGRYSLDVPPGVFTVRRVENGKEICTGGNQLGPCAVRVIDADIEHDVVLNLASH